MAGTNLKRARLQNRDIIPRSGDQQQLEITLESALPGPLGLDSFRHMVVTRTSGPVIALFPEGFVPPIHPCYVICFPIG